VRTVDPAQAVHQCGRRLQRVRLLPQRLAQLVQGLDGILRIIRVEDLLEQRILWLRQFGQLGIIRLRLVRVLGQRILRLRQLGIIGIIRIVIDTGQLVRILVQLTVDNGSPRPANPPSVTMCLTPGPCACRPFPTESVGSAAVAADPWPPHSPPSACSSP